MRPHQAHPLNHTKPNQHGSIRSFTTFVVICVLLLGVINTYRSVTVHANSAMPEITSTIEGYCLDDHSDSSAENAIVDTWPCNDTAAENWNIKGSAIEHNDTSCLDILDNGTHQGDKVVLNACNNSLGQVWSVYLSGFENPNSGMCLAVPNNNAGQQLIISSCNNISDINEGWAAVKWSDPKATGIDCRAGTEGQKVACEAELQWAAWQSNTQNHTALLNKYTDGNSYEEWCADFVSYVYQQAGYPFSDGERDGWDEYDANSIQNMGFTLHPAGSYIPKPGDVAYFDYPGGHVEIVTVGGSTPTFIYGDSGTTDPITQNGEMNEDMLSSDGSAGQVQYYLSPN